MRNLRHILTRRMFVLVPAVAAFAFSVASCQQGAIKANEQQVQQQQQQIEQMQEQIEMLKARQSYSTAPAAQGGCDPNVMKTATKHGGEKFAAGDFSRALGYYQDALAACPGDANAEINVARTYEALNNRASAIEHYRRAAASTDPSQASAEQQARDALARFGAR